MWWGQLLRDAIVALVSLFLNVRFGECVVHGVRAEQLVAM